MSPEHGRRRGAALSSEEELERWRARREREDEGENPGHRAESEPSDDDAAAAPFPESSATPEDEPAAVPAPPRRWRPELQGLRAVAILMVVCYHIWFGRVSGGVDIFLLISAFLLTGSFVRKMEDGRPLAVPRYWAHVFQRLVPPAAVVVVLTIGLAVAFFPPNRFDGIVTQALASLTYWENWYLAAQGVDYYATDRSVVSPFQHFWSLSVQGQVFVLWPLLLLVCAGLSRALRARPRTVVLVVFGLLTAGSLAWSIHQTATDQQLAYFDTRSRLWEFSLGSVLAIVLPLLERRRRSVDADGVPAVPAPGRALLGWVGIAAILACGWVVDVEGAFPGWIALWPLLAACLVIGVGRTGTRWGADRILASRPLRWVGDVSYALYLVHWPLLVTLLIILDADSLTWWQGTLLVATSLVLAWLLTIGVDTPVRRWRWAGAKAWRAGLVVACALLLGLAPALALHLYTDRSVVEAGTGRYPGAEALLPGAPPVPSPLRGVPYTPALDQLETQWVWFPEPCDLPSGTKILCDQLLPDSAGHPRLVLYGNSHAQQQGAMFLGIAGREGWQLQRPTLSGCDYTPIPPGVATADATECQVWNTRMRALLAKDPPDVVVLTSTQVDYAREGKEITTPGYPELARFLVDHGIDVIAVRDNPRFPVSVPECVHREGPRSSACSRPRTDLFAPSDPAPDIAPGPDAQVYTLDLTDEYCPDGVCRPVIGNVLVYLDDNHVTSTYARTLDPFVRQQLASQGFTW